jgi:glycosyltransferase involved in cell wall biosynthesis
MFFSICICTYNRVRILRYCLDAIARLDDPRPAHEVEVIVVDNNSSDDTPSAIREAMQHTPFPLRYVREPRQGLSTARNRAVDTAHGDYLAFLDDECLVDRNWLTVAAAAVCGNNAYLVGGPYYGAFLPGYHPEWFKVEYGNAYFLEHDLHRGFHADFRASGGNMIVNAEVFREFRFDDRLGVAGSRLSLGEEIDLQDRYLRAHPNERVFYEPRLIVHHLILPNKLCLSYRCRRLFREALTRPEPERLPFPARELCKALAHLALAPAKCIWRDRHQYRYWQNYVYERALPAISPRFGLFARYLRDRIPHNAQADSRSPATSDRAA